MIIFQKPAEEKVEELAALTNNTETFETAEVTASVAVLVTATEEVAGNKTVIYTIQAKLCLMLFIFMIAN